MRALLRSLFVFFLVSLPLVGIGYLLSEEFSWGVMAIMLYGWCVFDFSFYLSEKVKEN